MSLAAFHDVRFPLPLGLGASGGPAWQTEIVTLASGAEIRNARWAGSRRRWDLVSAISTVQDLAVLSAFFEARRGRLHGFRFRDPADHTSAAPGAAVTATDQLIASGDGSTTAFQLLKNYGGVTRPITRPVAGSVRLALDGAEQGAGWSVDAATGLVSFDTPPAAGVSIAAGFEFGCPVRFDTDQLDLTLDMIGAGRALSVPIVELAGAGA